jgi:hypothetical protein
MPDWKHVLIRVAAIVVALGAWFFTQWLLARRPTPALPGGMTLSDGVHQWTARWNELLNRHPKLADRLLIGSSLVIDLLGLFVLALSIFGPTLRPFVAMLLVFAMRQLCQFCSPLPPPVGMVWRYPGVPSLLVTYNTTTDFFFSGHTSLAVLGAVCLGVVLGPIGVAIGIALALFEMLTVLALRAHYTMDVFTGGIASLYAWQLAGWIAPTIDGWIGAMG